MLLGSSREMPLNLLPTAQLQVKGSTRVFSRLVGLLCHGAQFVGMEVLAVLRCVARRRGSPVLPGPPGTFPLLPPSLPAFHASP